VLRLMAAVIHALWQRQDGNLLILPASVPIDDPAVQFELTRYLEDPWVPIIEKDVDGPHSLPLRLDGEHPNLGRYSACRRVARTIYLGSAPTLHSANRGIEERRIKLGCVQPGESVATFGDALRRLTEQATHLYVQEKRYWYSTQPSVARLAQDRAAFLHAHANAEIVLLDVPLLYETGLDRTCDAVAVVSAPPEAQRQRVLARGMTEAEFDMLLCRQLSDAEKRRRATYIIPTTSLEAARQAVKDVLADIRRTLYA